MEVKSSLMPINSGLLFQQCAKEPIMSATQYLGGEIWLDQKDNSAFRSE
jgi:hypothetical protein